MEIDMFKTPLPELEKMLGFNPKALCIYCEEPVGRLSFGGARVCPSCDCGHNKDGTPWTIPQATLYYANARKNLSK